MVLSSYSRVAGQIQPQKMRPNRTVTITGMSAASKKRRINLQAGGDLADYGQRVADLYVKYGGGPGGALDRVEIVFRVADKRIGERFHDVIEQLFGRLEQVIGMRGHISLVNADTGQQDQYQEYAGQGDPTQFVQVADMRFHAT